MRDAKTGEPIGRYFEYLHDIGLIRLKDVVFKKIIEKIGLKMPVLENKSWL